MVSHRGLQYTPADAVRRSSPHLPFSPKMLACQPPVGIMLKLFHSTSITGHIFQENSQENELAGKRQLALSVSLSCSKLSMKGDPQFALVLNARVSCGLNQQ